MTPTLDFMYQANDCIRKVLMDVRPQVLEASGKIAHTLKDDKSVVTEMDMLVENKLRDALAHLDGGIPFSGEESGVDYTQPTFWLVDPIDGTESFLRGIPGFCSMISLISNGQPVMGVTYNFSLNEYYLAFKGQGATCNGHPIHVSSRNLERSYIILTGDMSSIGKQGFSDYLRPYIKGMPKFHASGYESALIAKGAVEGCVVLGNKGAWDFAAGSLLIQEAGGIVQNLGSDTYDFRDLTFIAGSSTVFPRLRELFEQYRS